MIEIHAWTDNFLKVLEQKFGSRIWFAGLQGSRGRGEAGECSDIDLVVILDILSPEDIEAYNEMLDTLPDRELICGFLSGKEELLSWEPADLFQFYYDTEPLKGSLDELVPLLDKTAVERAVRTGACNIYHGCVHNMLYEKEEEILKSLYKAAVFVIQASWFKRTGVYVKRHSDLAEDVDDRDREIVRTAMELKQGGKVRFREMSGVLFEWAKAQIINISSGRISPGQGFERLERNITDVVKEQQAKLGYRKENIRLYYPLSSLNHFFSGTYDAEGMKNLLKEFPAFAGKRLGEIKISADGNRFCFRIPQEGAEYVHSRMEENEFIVELVKAVSSHGCTMEEIRNLFCRYSDHVCFQKMNNGEFDYLIRFAGGGDDYLYCFKEEGCHITYHRFLPEDYRDLGLDENRRLRPAGTDRTE